MEKDILLTISVLVSGREDTTRKCLDSLQDLRRQIPCELLLTDTGCPEDMRGWLEAYADEVYDFTWCNDFAVARNVGAKAAKGKWFLYLDDDEWFEDTSGIVSFLQSGEYKQYHTAFYKVRNYEDRSGLRYRDSYVSRMVEMRKDTQFVYPIHEALMPTLHPVKYLDDFVHHYGYVYDSAEEEDAKTKRNLTLLHQALQEDRHCLRYHLELVLEYNSIMDYKSSIEISYQGIVDYDTSDSGNLKNVTVLYANIVRCYISIGEYEKACKEAARFILEDKISALSVATICGDVMYACYRTESYDRGLLYLEKYLQLMEAFDKNREAYLEQQTAVLETCFEKGRYQWNLAVGMALAAATGKRNKWKEIFQRESLEWWEAAINIWCTKVPNTEIESTKSGLEQLIRKEDLYQQYLLICMDKWVLLKMAEQKNEDERNNLSAYLKVMGSYSQRVVLYYKSIYHISIFEEYPELLPKEYNLARKFQLILQKVKQKDYVNALRELKKTAEMQTVMGEVIKRISNLLSHTSQEQSEFAYLAKQVKGKVWKMIQEGNNESARATLEQLRMLVPEDPELVLLQNSIRG